MIFPGSRYEKSGTYTVTRPDGKTVTVVKPPQALTNSILGFHRRLDGQRLDLIASNYFHDATGFWRLCDANNAIAPESLAAHALIGIPSKDQR